jgi:hypothetical protein
MIPPEVLRGRIFRLRCAGAGASEIRPGDHPGQRSWGGIVMQINVTYSTVNQTAYPAGFQAAINLIVQYFDHVITNNITVNIQVGFGTYDNGANPGGGAVENDFDNLHSTDNSVFVTYATLKAALQAHYNATGNPDDLTALASLPASDPFSPSQELNGGYYIQPSEARALGISVPNNTSIDAFIGFNGTQPYNFSENNRAISSMWDFYGVAFHEFSHALGRISTAGSPGFGPATLDLFRYSALNTRQIGNGVAAYFSINSGATDLDGYATSSDQGDWNSSAGNDGNKAISSYSVVNQWTATDNRMLDILGYTVQDRPNDFNGDGVSDLLWRNTSNGIFTAWNINGNQIAANAFVGNVSNTWTLAGTLDFNGDHASDLLFINGTTFTIWDATRGSGINNATYTADGFATNSFVGSVAAGWSLTGLGDFNGDGKGDLI